MKPVKRIIYDNYDVIADYAKDAIETLDASCNASEEPMESSIYDLCAQYARDTWDEESECLREFFNDSKDTTWLLVGTLGLWNGNFAGGFTFKNFGEMFYKATKDCDYWSLWDENGHFYLKCSHHDGTNMFEIREVTKAGEELIEDWEYADSEDPQYNFSEKELHKLLWENYSKLPHYAHTVYGCMETEYEPENAAKKVC